MNWTEKEWWHHIKDSGMITGAWVNMEWEELNDSAKNDLQMMFLLARGEYL